MNKLEGLFIFVIAIFGVIFLAQSVPQYTGMALNQPWAVYIPTDADIQALVIPGVGQAISTPVREYPATTAAGEIPYKGNLVPISTSFYVDSIPVMVNMQSPDFFPLSKYNMRVFSGKFGPYPENYNKFVYVELCSFVESQPEMFGCERIRNLNFVDGYLTFARGYDWDEYIAGLAMRNFGAYYVVKSTEYGPLATSKRAIINLVDT
jgi:hypothetical protein